MLGFETEEDQPKKKADIKIIPYHKNSMKIIRGNQYFILEPNRYDINTLMMLIDLKKINNLTSSNLKIGQELLIPTR